MFNNKNEDMVSATFSYTDEFGETCTVSKDVSADYMGETQLGVIDQLYHDFLLACGYTYLADKRVEWVDDDR